MNCGKSAALRRARDTATSFGRLREEAETCACNYAEISLEEQAVNKWSQPEHGCAPIWTIRRAAEIRYEEFRRYPKRSPAQRDLPAGPHVPHAAVQGVANDARILARTRHIESELRAVFLEKFVKLYLCNARLNYSDRIVHEILPALRMRSIFPKSTNALFSITGDRDP